MIRYMLLKIVKTIRTRPSVFKGVHSEQGEAELTVAQKTIANVQVF